MSEKEDKEFFKVFNDEMKKWIIPRRSKREKLPNNWNNDEGNYFPMVDNRLVGLALSGGGIRSATFALGALQRMARAGILKFVDVLSTASGGGYLGASWSSLTADPDIEREETNSPDEEPYFGSSETNFPFRFIDNHKDENRQLFDRESDAVRHLRAHGHWLAPHLGLFDVWTWVALFRYLFSTAINFILIPIPLVLGLMMLTLIIPSGLWNRGEPLSSWMWIGPAVLFSIFLFFVVWQITRQSERTTDKVNKTTSAGAETKHSLYWLQKSALVLGIVWLLVDLVVLGIAGAYLLQDFMQKWIITVGGSGAALVITGKIIYQFFTKEVQGGVTTNVMDGIGKKVLSALLGLVGYIALAILFLASYYAIDSYFFPKRIYQVILPDNVPAYIILTALAFVVAIGMLFMPVRWFLNTFSLQALYRRGMRKAYILRRARPNEQKVRPEKEVVSRNEPFMLTDLKKGENPPDMPYHLIGTAVNTSGDHDLERLGRRSDGFVFTHFHSGSRITGYGPTGTSEAFKHISLSEAMAISGAAFSPNMGRITTTSNSILLALLNARVGSWIQHPKYARKRPWYWPPLAWYWVKELFGIASAEDKYIYLSDGGHFDNSAIYELLKRRCKYIIAIDAGSEFDNLATVSRLARIDLGVQIDVNLEKFRPDPDTGLSRQAYVVAKLKYPPLPGDRKTEGVLVWLSTTMTHQQKPDVIKYKETNDDFPFTSTGDQLFDQHQFEAYRQLGYSAARTLLKNADLEKESVGVKKEKLTRRKLEKALNRLHKIAEL